MRLARRAVLAAGLAALAAGRAPAESTAPTEQGWTLDGLAGTLALPPAGGPRRPAVLILAGSGPTDRDGNGPGLSTNLYRTLALALAARGHVTLRYDKRGVAGSRALVRHEEDLAFSDFVGDAVRAARSLLARPDTDGVVLIGHSEGGLVALAAARQVPVRGVVLMAVPGRPLGALLRAQFAAAGLPPDLAAETERILEALERGETGIAVSPALAAAFRPSVQPYLVSVLTVDPAVALGALQVPALLLQGGRDLQVREADVARLAAAAPQAHVERLPEANHIFKRAPADRAANIATYGDPDAPLDPALVPAITAFLTALGPQPGQ